MFSIATDSQRQHEADTDRVVRVVALPDSYFDFDLVTDPPVLGKDLSPEERELELAFERMRRRKAARHFTTIIDLFGNELRLY